MTPARALIVEDEGIVALQIKSTLEARGVVVTATCARGEDALPALMAAPVDVVLMDLRLAGELDGVATALAIQAFRRVPIIFLTAHSDDATVERARSAAPYGYLLKPFNPEELCISIEVALHKHRLDEEKRVLVEQLEDALSKVRVLSGLLDICMGCKRIRDEHGAWRQLELFLRERSEAEFSHGLCPECADTLYPGLMSESEEPSRS